MKFDILTLFPEMFEAVFTTSIIGRAQERDQVEITVHNIRDYALGKHHVTDDTPYGGGGGMIMKPDPIFYAVEAILDIEIPPIGYASFLEQGYPPIILLTPQGRVFQQSIARDMLKHDRLIFICGRYEGIDERVRQYLVTDEMSIGDYVLSGGEIPAMVMVDTLTRLIPGVLGDEHATAKDSHSSGLLEHPHYTRPYEFRGHTPPDILLSGHHANQEIWRRQESLRRTHARRPELLNQVDLTAPDQQFLTSLAEDAET
ncbi:tRNA (guanosine(37)-N1)-methyltransferase TrmD [Anaerolineales bacterium HSG24]|nr:tRNA (guanosine(37)-N1)-methyltransferase TrmD [Anaerolineales bacterium HSG24]